MTKAKQILVYNTADGTGSSEAKINWSLVCSLFSTQGSKKFCFFYTLPRWQKELFLTEIIILLYKSLK